MDGRYDVVIIGGSLAGSAAGIAMSRLGRKVLILERGRLTPKVCGEVLSPGVWPLLEALGVREDVLALTGSPIREIRMTWPDRKSLCFALPSADPRTPYAYGISRERLDALLLDRARAAGCEVAEGYEVRSAARNADGFEVTAFGLPDRSIRKIYHAPLLVNAAGIPHTAGAKGHLGFKAHFRGPLSGGTSLYFFRGGYLGLGPVEDGRINLCGLAAAERYAEAGNTWDGVVKAAGRENKELGRWLAEGTRLSGWSSCGPVRHCLRRPDFSWGYPVGDAACFLEPFMGQGMTMAMASGLLLASLAGEETPGRHDGRLAAQYEKRIRGLYRSRILFGSLFRLASLPCIPWRGLIRAACRPPRLEAEFISSPSQNPSQFAMQGRPDKEKIL